MRAYRLESRGRRKVARLNIRITRERYTAEKFPQQAYLNIARPSFITASSDLFEAASLFAEICLKPFRVHPLLRDYCRWYGRERLSGISNLFERDYVAKKLELIRARIRTGPETFESLDGRGELSKASKD